MQMIKNYKYRRKSQDNKTTRIPFRQPNYYNVHEMANALCLETLVIKASGMLLN